MTIDHAKELNTLCADGLWMVAGTRICQILENDHVVSNNAEGLKVVQDLLQHLLDNEMYLEAATLQWGPDQFNTEPESTVRVFKAMQEGSTVLLMGASSMSKTYAAGAYMLLDYLRDPFYTTVKLAAVNEDHLRKNLFAHVVNLYRSCAIPSSYEITVQDSTLWMGVKAAGYGFGISGIAFKQSQETSGQFKGYKAQPVRKKKHEKFGYLSRLRVLGDECLPYWQKVKMADGSEMEIGEIVNKKLTANVLSINNLTGKIESKKITGWHAVPRRGRKIVGVESGDNLAFVTEDHPILTNKGYVSALQAANCGLSVATLNENISCNQNTIKGTEVHNHWWASWGRINLSKFRSNGKCESEVRSRSMSARVSSMEERHVGKFQPVGNQRSIHDAMGRSDVPVHNGMPSGIYEDFSCDKADWTSQDHNSGISRNDRPNGCSRLVSGRRRNFKKRSERISKTINVFVSEKRSGDADIQVIELRSSISIVSDQEGPRYRNGSSGNKMSDESDSTIHSCGFDLQNKRGEDSKKTRYPSRYEAADEKNMLHLPQGVYQNKESKDLRKGMQHEADQISWVTDPQDDEIVYCIDVEDNHNFFAGGIAVKNCQNWPSGPFKDFNSLVASKSGTELIKIACAFNPETTSVHVVQLAEPEHGWSVDDMDSLYDWNSKAGWRVCRLDAALSENVKQRTVVYPGLQTYEGFISYLKAGGDNSPNYSCFARGWPPMKGDVNTIIPPQWPQEARGEATFIENPEVFAAVDLAFMGKDSAQMAIGRWGLASGWEDHMGRFQPFKDRLNAAKDKPRHVLQIDQLIPMEKHDNTVRMAEEIMGRCKMLRIDPDHVAVDKTGYGFGTWSHLCKVWGDVLGIAWNEKASELKILAEDQNGADKQCDGIMSEMWWAFRRWLDPSCRAVLINPIIQPQPLHTQLTSRRYRTGAKGIKVEAKEEYKSRNQNSPDEADAVIMLLHLIRQTSDVIPGLVEHQNNRPEPGQTHIKLYSMKNYVNVEADDSISSDSTDES